MYREVSGGCLGLYILLSLSCGLLALAGCTGSTVEVPSAEQPVAYQQVGQLKAQTVQGMVELRWQVVGDGVAPSEFQVERAVGAVTMPASWLTRARTWETVFAEPLPDREVRYRIAAVAPGGGLAGYSNPVSIIVSSDDATNSGAASYASGYLSWQTQFPIAMSQSEVRLFFDTSHATLCRIDGVPEFLCTSPWILSDLVEGTHSLQIRLPDTPGSSLYGQLVVDRTSPTIGMQVRPQFSETTRDIAYQITSDEPLASLRCELVGTDVLQPCPAAGWLPWDGQPALFQVEAWDRAGNRSVRQLSIGAQPRSVDYNPPHVQVEALDRAFLVRFEDHGSYSVTLTGPDTDIRLAAVTEPEIRLPAAQCGALYYLEVGEGTHYRRHTLVARAGLAPPRIKLHYRFGGIRFVVADGERLTLDAGGQRTSFSSGSHRYWWQNDSPITLALEKKSGTCLSPGSLFTVEPPDDLTRQRGISLLGISQPIAAESVSDFTGDGIDDLAVTLSGGANQLDLVWRDGAKGNVFGSTVSHASKIWKLPPNGVFPGDTFAARTGTDSIVFAAGGEWLSSIRFEHALPDLFAVGTSEIAFVTGNPTAYMGSGQIGWYNHEGTQKGVLVGTDTSAHLGQAPLVIEIQGRQLVTFGVRHNEQLYWEGYDPVTGNTVLSIALEGNSLEKAVSIEGTVLLQSRKDDTTLISLFDPSTGLIVYTLPAGELWTGQTLLADTFETPDGRQPAYVLAAQRGSSFVPYLVSRSREQPVPLRFNGDGQSMILSQVGQKDWVVSGPREAVVDIVGASTPVPTGTGTHLYRKVADNHFLPTQATYAARGSGKIGLIFDNGETQELHASRADLPVTLSTRNAVHYNQFSATDSFGRLNTVHLAGVIVEDRRLCSFPGAGFGDLLFVDDLTTDGIPDLIVADTSYNNAQGRVYLIDGSNCQVVRFLDGSQTWSYLGERIVPIWDYNGNGSRDLLISGIGDGSGREGQVRIWDPKNGQILKTFTGNANGDHFGTALAIISDRNSDGIPDFAIASGSSDTFGLNAGRIDIVASTGGILSSWAGNGDAYWGNALGIVGSGVQEKWFVGGLLNGQGFLRLATYGDPNAGRRILEGQGQERLGEILQVAPDLDGDGIKDIYVTGRTRSPLLQGDVYLLSGATGLALAHRRGTPGELWGQQIVPLADINNDGIPEILVGAPGRGGGALDLLDGRTLVVCGSLGSAYDNTIAWGDSLAVRWDGHRGWLAASETRYIDSPFNQNTSANGYITISTLTGSGLLAP